MNIDVFNEATELYNKYKLCEEVLKYLSNVGVVKGQKYKDTLATFADTFRSDFMMFVHERLTVTGEAFEECGKCECDNCPAEEEPTPAEEPKFHIGDRVKVIVDHAVLTGRIGTVTDFNTEGYEVKYGVHLDEAPENSLLWFTDYEIEPYVESEEPEQPTPPSEPSEPKFPIGSMVEIVGGEFDGCVGIVKDSDEKEGSYYVMSGVVGSGNQFSMWFVESNLKSVY